MQNKFASGIFLSENFKKKFSNLLKITTLLLTAIAFSATAVATEATSLAQKIKVTGTVIASEDNTPLPGVNIRVANTNTGVTTDMNGKYSIEVDDASTVLVFSYIGYVTEEIPVNGRSVIDVAMVPDISRLEEVVVIGYGSTAKKNVASATAALKTDDITGLSTTDIRETMQGKLSGVQVTSNNGDPGSSASVVIRGMGSFTNVNPLYVIDGIQGGDLNSVSPQDVESITILKDASTTAIYGTAAANGVVIITTKSGKAGSLKVTYEGGIGVASIPKRIDLLKAADYVDLVADIQHASGLELTEKLESPDVLIDRTDWQEEVFQNALVHDHNIRMSGGTESMTYAFSVGYQDEGSTVIDQNFKRLNASAKLSENLFNSRVRLNQNIRVRQEFTKGVLANFNDAFRMPPYIAVKDPDNLGGYGRADKVTDLNDANNPWNSVKNSDYSSNSFNLELDINGEVDIIKGLTFKSQGRLVTLNNHNYNWNYPSNGGNFIKLSSDMSETYAYQYGAIWENFFNFNKTLGSHDISATMGNTWIPGNRFRSVTVGGSEFTSDAVKNVALANVTSITGASVNSLRSRLSYFGRLGYTFQEKYVLNFTLRRDASAVFGDNYRWGTFYGAGLAWTVTKESFMSNLPTVSNLKLRASYGQTGNDNIRMFQATSNVWKGDANNIVYSFGDDLGYSYGSIINSVPNPYLKWEQTSQLDIGFDLGVFNNKLTFVFDYFHRNNEDLLIQTQLPLSSGLGNPGQQGFQFVNAASMKNSGVEMALTYANSGSVFKWDLSLNATIGSNEVTALGTLGNTPIVSPEFTGGTSNPTRTDIGQPLASFYGYKFDHIAVSQDEVDQLNASASEATGGAVTEYKVGLRPGDRIWQDVDGNGYIDDKDRTFIGDPSPRVQYGAVFNASYKNLDLQLTVFGLAGVDVLNGNRYWWQGMSKPFNQTTDVLRRWKQDGDVTDMPAAGQNSASNLVMSDWYVEKGDFLRVKNITLGYTLPRSFLKNTIDQLRIFVSVQNALTLTKYTGFDPEISTYAPEDNNIAIFSRGIDLYNHPNPRIYRLGVQLNF